MTSTPPLFTVVVPTFGRREYLRQALESVAAQTVDSFECLVVDDGSTQPAQLIADPRFRLIRRAINGGQAAALNTGIESAQGRYLAFLDDDDLMMPQRLEIALEGLAEAPVAICLSQPFEEGAGVRVRRKPRTWNGDVSDSIREGTTPNVGQTAIARDTVIAFDETFTASADVEWWIRLARISRVKTVEKIGHLYRVHGALRHNSPSSARRDALLRIHELHRGYFDANLRASAFHFRRVGLLSLQAGRPAESLPMFMRSLARQPHPKTLWHLARACLKAVRS